MISPATAGEHWKRESHFTNESASGPSEGGVAEQGASNSQPRTPNIPRPQFALFSFPPVGLGRGGASHLLNWLRSMSWFGCRPLCLMGMLLGLNWFACQAWAGGSGLNTMIVINQNSSMSVALGNFYRERRQIPPENVLRIAWTGGNTAWDVTQFQTNLLQPLLQAIAARGLSNQIHFVVLSMDIPYQTVNGTSVNGTTSSLFYGVKTELGLGGLTLTNSYFASEKIFPDAAPASAPGYSFLTTMITATNLARAKQLVEQGVTSDATFPSAPVHLAKTSDLLRRLRYTLFDNALFNTRLCGDYNIVRTNSNSPQGLSGLLGYQTGLMLFNISPNTFVPGAMADSLTSFAGILFGNSGQTSLMEFIYAGAAGSYGTVVEPSANVAKFPNPQNYFYQARGFSLAECYYQSLNIPYQGVIVGEPLAAPFASPGTGNWLNPAPGAILSGTAALAVQFSASDAARPLQRVDLFVDGKFFATLTNVVPRAGNQVSVRIGNQSATYSVPANATLASIATGLAAALNTPAISNETRTLVIPFGDRVELRYQGTNRPGSPFNLHVIALNDSNPSIPNGPSFDTTIGTGGALTTFVAPARSVFLDSPAYGIRNCTVGGTVQVGGWLRLIVTKTNGAVVTVAYTNQTAGATTADVLANLFPLINATAALQGADGLGAEDLSVGGVGLPNFNLLARAPGLEAARIRVRLDSSGTMVGTPISDTALMSNFSDLQPRNHLYLNAGGPELTVSFTLNTTGFADGFHELTAVAYEGTHVRTQTRTTLPVRIQNTPLIASLNLLDLAPTNSVAGNYSIQVAANTNNIARITLSSTGGVLNTTTGQATSTFSVSGGALGAGEHPFYAVVQDTLGRQYRTATQKVRLQ
jgi:uncharacterized protein (TIGR03790 family)